MNMLMDHRWNDTDRGKPELLGDKPQPVPTCVPQILHGLDGNRNRASAVRSRRTNAWDMAQRRSTTTTSGWFLRWWLQVFSMRYELYFIVHV